VLPLALALRFAVLAPLSWMFPAVRRVTLAHASSLVINPAYVRRTAMTRGGLAQEIACTTLVWIALASWTAGIVPTAALLCWLLVVSSASVVNGIRTLAAHRYAHDESGREFTTLEQLLDTCTLEGRHPLHMLGAPVGLRYHALHHWIPALPYHNLPRAHRRLASSLPDGEPYRTTAVRSIRGAIADLVTRASRASSSGVD
jgi:fatty acid desaturase